MCHPSRDGEVTGPYPTQRGANRGTGCLFLPLPLLPQDPRLPPPSIRSVIGLNAHTAHRTAKVSATETGIIRLIIQFNILNPRAVQF